jgi:glycerophosphoryl diester phosphodiesterase
MICIGHRGAAGHAPENTLLAIERAFALGVNSFEVDVRNVHGELIIFHDDTVDRITTASGRLSDFSIEELRSLDLGEGQKIPFLREILCALPPETNINLELAGYDTAKETLEIISDCNIDQNRVLISSFLHPELEIVRSFNSEIKIATLIGHHPCDIGFARDLQSYAINYQRDYFNADAVKMAKDAGFRVMVYTVNDPRDMQDMKEMGVDAIFCDYPERAKSLCSFGKLLRD